MKPHRSHAAPIHAPPPRPRCFLARVGSLLTVLALSAALPAAEPGSGPAVAERPHASGISLRSLDLSDGRAPTEAELRAAGQLGSPLSPGRRRPHAVTAAVGSPAHAAEEEAADRRQFGEAMQLWNAHHFRRARELFVAHRDAHPGSPWAGEAELHVGCEAQFGGDWPTARRYFENILAAEEPGSDIYQKARLRRAVLHLEQGELEESTAAFAQLLDQETDWQRRTYAHTWIRQLADFRANEVALRDCGAQSIAYVLRARGRTAEADAAALAPAAGKRGFSVGELGDFARGRGLEPVAAVHSDATDLANLPAPFVAHYRDRHFVVVVGPGDGPGEVKVYDPRLRREVALSAESFASQWSGLALVFAPVGESVRLASAAEQAENFGGCCGVPRPEDDLGPTSCPAPATSGSGAPTCGSCRGMPEWSVNPSNMNLTVQDIPLWYDNPVGPKVEIHLVYNSQDALNQLRPFGNKWTFNYASYAMESPSSSLPRGTVTIVMPGGRRDSYQPDGGTVGYVAPVGIFTTLVKTGPHSFLLSDQDGTVFSYGVPPEMRANSTSTLLLSMTDRYGVGLTFGHDAHGRLTSITDHWDRVTTLHYNAAGLVDDAVDPFGRHATFTYDAAHNLTDQTDMGSVAYGYNYDANVYLTALRKPTGTTAFYVEPADGIKPDDDPYNRYPPLGRQPMWQNYRITITDPLGQGEEYYYNGYSSYGWHRDKRQYVPNQTADQALNSPMTHFDYTMIAGGKARLNRTVLSDNTWIGQYNFNAQGQAETAYDARAQYDYYTYNSAGRVLTDLRTRNIPEISSYEVTAYEYAPNGLDLTRIIERPGTTAERIKEQRTYDNSRNLLTFSDALNHPTTYTYNAFGQVATVTNALNEPPTVYTYNNLRQLTTVTRNNVTLSGTAYDAVGRVHSRTDADGFTLIYEYDDLNRLTRTLYPDSTDEKKQWGCCHLDSDTDRAGKTTFYSYDALNRLHSKTDPLNQTITYDYDPNGNLAQLTDAKSQATRWEYDSRNRVHKKLYADNTFETSEYDGGGNLTSFTDAKGIQTSYNYDEDSRLLDRYVEHSTAPVPNVHFTYDVCGRRATMREDEFSYAQTTTYAYDAADRLTGIDGPLADDDVTFGYDALNRPTSRTIHGGAPVTTGYDVFGRVTSVNNVLGAFSHTYAGSASPRLAGVSLPNGIDIRNGYHEGSGDFRLQSITAYAPEEENGSRALRRSGPRPRSGTGGGPVIIPPEDPADSRTVLSVDSLDYAPRGEITSWRREVLGVPDFDRTILYDAVGQLSRVDDSINPNSGFSSYTYDAAGNPQMWGSESSAYNFSNQLTYRYVWTQGASENPTYDANGNQTGKGITYPSELNALYEWDGLNRLTAFVQNGHRSEFTYNGLGQRVGIVEKTIDPGTGSATVTAERRFLWVGAEIVREQETLSGVTKEFLPQGFKVTGGSAANPVSFFYVRDHLGSVREVYDATAARRARYGYDPYGRRTKLFGASGDMESDFGYTGHLFHAPSGLHLAMYRAYDAGIGRWLNRDLIAERGGLNLYSYVLNSPINLSDPFGLYPPSHPHCKRLRQKIQNTIDEIDKRGRELRDDRQGLPGKTPNDKFKPRESRRGHDGLLNMAKARLAAQQADYAANCNDPEPPQSPCPITDPDQSPPPGAIIMILIILSSLEAVPN